MNLGEFEQNATRGRGVLKRTKASNVSADDSSAMDRDCPPSLAGRRRSIATHEKAVRYA